MGVSGTPTRVLDTPGTALYTPTYTHVSVGHPHVSAGHSYASVGHTHMSAGHTYGISSTFSCGSIASTLPGTCEGQQGRCKATWKREFKLPWREAGPPIHLDDKVDSDQQVAKNKSRSLQGIFNPLG